MTIKTYPRMNAEIVEILRAVNNPVLLYAAQRIEELEAEIEQLQSENKGLKGCDATIALLSHQMKATCEQVGLGVGHALHDYIPLLGNQINILTREARRLRGSLTAILDEAISDLDRDIVITECQSALSSCGEETSNAGT